MNFISHNKKLRKRNRELRASTALPSVPQSDQAISDEASTEATSVRPGPGNKLDVPAPAGPSVKPQASSSKQQASSNTKPEPSSGSSNI